MVPGLFAAAADLHAALLLLLHLHCRPTSRMRMQGTLHSAFLCCLHRKRIQHSGFVPFQSSSAPVCCRCGCPAAPGGGAKPCLPCRASCTGLPSEDSSMPGVRCTMEAGCRERQPQINRLLGAAD